MLVPYSSRLLVIVFIATVHFVLADVFVGCFDPRVLPIPGGMVYDSYLDNCQDICRSSGTEYSYSWPDPEDQGDFPTFRICQCGFAQPDGHYLIPTSLCDYPNVQTVLPSGFVGKRRIDDGGQEEDLCPEGSRACKVGPGVASQLDYECIATDEELESCGGCLFGDMIPGGKLSDLGEVSNAAGTDCTQIAGVRPDGVTLSMEGTFKYGAWQDNI
ncbi:hypothetical protein I302_105345 [Kwoniella bestiolae CBS 10118]|uniref:Protein CPL1-like domain-containing protein n=1 Tax=Kwoniella bestiolae CBS 10118 TaxID=1296100 RepID=A0AAJ8K8R2_9TREE